MWLKFYSGLDPIQKEYDEHNSEWILVGASFNTWLQRADGPSRR